MVASTGIPSYRLPWRVPYLPIDPADLGRSYESVIRVNSQSGKGGIAYLLERDFGIEMPRRLQMDFSRRVQHYADDSGLEVDSAQLLSLFETSYVTVNPLSVEVLELDITTAGGETRTVLRVDIDGTERAGTAIGVGLVEATALLLDAAGMPVDIVSLHQTSLAAGNDSDALTLIEYRHGVDTKWAAGRGRSVLDATVLAVINAAVGGSGSAVVGCPRGELPVADS